ncbi:MAG TPA: hypothetical protein PLX53_06380 [Tenuifilaceae bacterium]|nr:hypothetical protein [Tenuifilaceae bacterium]
MIILQGKQHCKITCMFIVKVNMQVLKAAFKKSLNAYRVESLLSGLKNSSSSIIWS